MYLKMWVWSALYEEKKKPQAGRRVPVWNVSESGDARYAAICTWSATRYRWKNEASVQETGRYGGALAELRERPTAWILKYMAGGKCERIA